jgi:hypothetical protein
MQLALTNWPKDPVFGQYPVPEADTCGEVVNLMSVPAGLFN